MDVLTDPSQITNIKCRKCRRMLLDDAGVLENILYAPVQCCDTMRQIIGVVESDGSDSCPNLPDWIINSLEQNEWIKGKLNCPHCSAKVGCFGFVGGSKCGCRKSFIPGIYLLRKTVDFHPESSDNSVPN